MTEKRFDKQIGSDYELFRLASPHYDELQNSVGKLINENFSHKNQSEIKVLEIGFGDGTTSLIILNSDQRVHLTLIDSEPLMLKKATEKLDPIKNTRYSVLLDDALSFLKKTPSNSLDVVASAFTLHNFNREYRSDVLKEIHRVLIPSGIFINADKIEVTDRDDHEKNMQIQLSKFDVFEKVGRPELKTEWTEHYLQDSEPERALIEDEFEKELKSLGFSYFKIISRWYDDAVSLIVK